MGQATQNLDVLGNGENIKILANVLKTNVSACTSIGSFYLPQIGRIFLDMLGLYKAVSGIISETIVKEGLSIQLSSEGGNSTEYIDRFNCHQDAKNSAVANCKEGDLEAYGNIYKEGGGLGICQQHFHAILA